MGTLTKAIAIVRLIVAAIFNAYCQVLRGFSYLLSAIIVLMLVVIALLVLQKRA